MHPYSGIDPGEKKKILSVVREGKHEHLQEKNNPDFTPKPEGRLDAGSSPQLEAELKRSIDGVACLILDLGALDHVSSAGLSVFLSAQKIMNRQGKMFTRNVNENIMEIFDGAGFAGILAIARCRTIPAKQGSFYERYS